MKLASITVAFDSLVTSPLNVRQAADDPDLEHLAASILAKGLIQPIAVHAVRKPKGAFGVIAGGRRFRAIGLLKLRDADFDFDAIPAVQLEGSESELIEASLTENYLRAAMTTAEVYIAFRRIREKNPDISDAELGTHFGYEASRVQRIMRLANLHPTIFAAFAASKINDAQAKAYAASSDQELQLAVWNQQQALDYNRHNAHYVRKMLGFGGDAVDQAAFAIVGREAYEEAGGRFEQDIFADDPNHGRVLDQEILNRLYRGKMVEAQTTLLATVERPEEITFADEPPQGPYGHGDYRLRVEAQPEPLNDEQQAEVDAAEARLEAIERRICEIVDEDADSDDFEDVALPGHEDELCALKAEEEQLEARRDKILDDRKAIVREGPKIAVARARGTEIAFELWWPDLKSAGLKEPAPRTGSGLGYVDLAKEAGLSNDAAQVMKSTYRTTAQALLAMDGEDGCGFAFDYLLFSQVRAVLRLKRQVYSGMESWGSPDGKSVGLHDWLKPAMTMDRLELEIAHQPGSVYLSRLRELLLAEPAFTHHDPVAGFELFRVADEQVKHRCIGFLASFALDRSMNMKGHENRFVDYIGATLTGGSNQPVRDHCWNPDAIYLKRLAKKHRLAILERIGGDELVKRTKGMKADEVTTFVERILRANDEDVQLLGIDEETRAAAIHWLPAYLEFPSREAIDRAAPATPKATTAGEKGSADADLPEDPPAPANDEPEPAAEAAE